MSFLVERVFGVAGVVRPAEVSRRRFGVPPRGPFDRESFALANALIGNEPNAEALELLGGSVALLAEKPALVACVGAVGSIAVDGAPKPPQSSFRVEVGQHLAVSVGPSGNALYIAAFGGWNEPRVVKEGLGRRLSDALISLSSSDLRYLPAEGFEDLAIPVLTVHPSSNRAGIRLDGMPPSGLQERPSEPCCVGTMQWTPSGQIILVGPDGPTIGGYPKIGYIVEADLDRMAHLRVASKKSFSPLTFGAVGTLAKERGDFLTSRIRQLRAAKFLFE